MEGVIIVVEDFKTKITDDEYMRLMDSLMVVHKEHMLMRKKDDEIKKLGLEVYALRERTDRLEAEIKHKNEKFSEWCVEYRELKEQNEKLSMIVLEMEEEKNDWISTRDADVRNAIRNEIEKVKKINDSIVNIEDFEPYIIKLTEENKELKKYRNSIHSVWQQLYYIDEIDNSEIDDLFHNISLCSDYYDNKEKAKELWDDDTSDEEYADETQIMGEIRRMGLCASDC